MTEPASEHGERQREGLDSGRSATLVGAGIFLSRISGLVREAAMAWLLGLGIAADAFRAALRIPNLLQNLFGEGALSAAFIPVYARLLDQGREEEADRVAGAVAGLLALVTGVIVVVAVLFAEPITSVLAFGLRGETFDLTVTLVRIMTAGIGFLVLSAWCLGVLNSHRRFFLPYVAPVAWNAAQLAVLVVVAILGWEPDDIAVALAWGVFCGGVLQFAVQVPAVRKAAPGIRLSLRTDLDGVRTTVRRFGPALLGRGVVQIGAYVDLALATLLATGAIAALATAQVLYLLPVALFGISVAAAELPELSRAEQRDDELRERLTTGLGRIAFFVTFCVIAYLCAGNLIVAAVYQRFEFDADDTLLVWLTLSAYSIGLVAVTASRLMQNVLYARGDVAGPARIAATRVTVAALAGAVLMFQLDRVLIVDGALVGLDRAFEQLYLEPLSVAIRSASDLPLRVGAVGLALASGLAAWLELGLLRSRLRRELGRIPPVLGPARRLLGPAAAAAALMIVLNLMIVHNAVTGAVPVLVAAPFVVGAGGVTYVSLAAITGIPEAKSLAARAARLISR